MAAGRARAGAGGERHRAQDEGVYGDLEPSEKLPAGIKLALGPDATGVGWVYQNPHSGQLAQATTGYATYPVIALLTTAALRLPISACCCMISTRRRSTSATRTTLEEFFIFFSERRAPM